MEDVAQDKQSHGASGDRLASIDALRGFDMFWNPPQKAENISSLLLRETGVNTAHFDSCWLPDRY